MDQRASDRRSDRAGEGHRLPADTDALRGYRSERRRSRMRRFRTGPVRVEKRRVPGFRPADPLSWPTRHLQCTSRLYSRLYPLAQMRTRLLIISDLDIRRALDG